jgi:hypothetical protein
MDLLVGTALTGDWQKPAMQSVIVTEVAGNKLGKADEDLLVDGLLNSDSHPYKDLSPKEQRDVLAGFVLPPNDPFVQQTLAEHPEDQHLLLLAWHSICADREMMELRSTEAAVKTYVLPVLDDYHKRGLFQNGDDIEKKRQEDPKFKLDLDAAMEKVRQQDDELLLLLPEADLQTRFEELKAAAAKARN